MPEGRKEIRKKERKKGASSSFGSFLQSIFFSIIFQSNPLAKSTERGREKREKLFESVFIVHVRTVLQIGLNFSIQRYEGYCIVCVMRTEPI